VHRGGFEPP